MKTKQLLYVLITMSLFCQCRAKKKTISDKKTIIIEYSEMYCGGAAPPDELVKEMATLKMFANREIEFFSSLDEKAKPHKYTTNELGEIKIPVSLGPKVYLNLYPSLENFKAEIGEFDCYKDFIKNSLIEINLTNSDKIIPIITLIKCNPCVPAAP